MRMALFHALLLILTACVAAQCGDGPKNSETTHKERVKDVTHPIPISTPQPKYPKEARKQKIKGVVVVQCLVGEDGNIHNPKVVRSLSPELDASALQAVEQWKFKPAKRDGKPVAVQMNIELSFDLDNSRW